jgi:tetratricopeptide (TPR) repeat protein
MEPRFFEIDERMRESCEALERGDEIASADLGLHTWAAVARLARERGLTTLEAFDDAFQGSQYVFNWVQDLDATLHSAGYADPRFWEEGIRHCEEFLELFPLEDGLTLENKRRRMAELHASLDRRDVSDRLYREWLDADPSWGWGWIGWADTYFLGASGDRRQPERAEALLLDGLAVPDVRDLGDVLDRLVVLYEETGRMDEADEMRGRIAGLAEREPDVSVSIDSETGSRKVSFDFGEDGPPLERLGEIRSVARQILEGNSEVRRVRVGRNEPCPCGSGRKFKKCCGR